MLHVWNVRRAVTTVYRAGKVMTDFIPLPFKYSMGYSHFGSSNLPVLEALHMLLHLTSTLTCLIHTHSLVIAQMLLLDSMTPNIK